MGIIGDGSGMWGNFVWPLVVALMAIGAAKATVVVWQRRRKRKTGLGLALALPPGPRRWPIVGNLLQIGRVPHEGMMRLTERYGPLVYMHIGMVPALVTGEPRFVRAFLLKHDHDFASRPHNIASQHFTFGGHDIAFAPYGAHWRRVRKLCSSELLAPRRLDSHALRRARHDEAMCMLAHAHAAALRQNPLLNMRDLFGTLTSNSITRMLLGQRFFGPPGAGPHVAAQHKALIYESFSLINAFNVADYIPFLRPLDPQGHERRMRRIMAWVNRLYDDLIQRQRLLFQQQQQPRTEPPVSFLHTMFAAQAQDASLTDTAIKAILIDMVAAGTDTSTVTSEWTMAELLRHPEYMQRVQAEIDSIVGTERLVEEADLVKLRQLRAVVKEVFRLHPVGGFLIPHVCMRDTTVEGYHVPKNTRVLINTYALGRNPGVWEKPCCFRPERFLQQKQGDEEEETIEFTDPQCRLVPFGAGRRGCPGATLGMQVVLLAVARLLQLFHWDSVDSDMADAVGYTVKAVPLEARPSLRADRLHLLPPPST